MPILEIDEIIRAGQGRVNHPPPFLRLAFLDCERKRLPVSINHHVEIIVILRGSMKAVGQAVRIVRPVHLPTYAVPLHVVTPEQGTSQGRVALVEAEHAPEETKYVAVLTGTAPVEPSGRAVYVVRVPLAALGLEEFVSGS